jgi:hypothetical protein
VEQDFQDILIGRVGTDERVARITHDRVFAHASGIPAGDSLIDLGGHP